MELFPDSEAESFGDGVRIWENEDVPADQASGSGIHPCSKYRADGDLLFIRTVVFLPGNSGFDKEIEYMMVALPANSG